MPSDDTKPGLPSADEVRAHAERYPFIAKHRNPRTKIGLWMGRKEGAPPVFAEMFVHAGSVVAVGHGAGGNNREYTWHPCTPDGRDVADVEALAERCHGERQAANACADDSAEIDRLRFSAHLERASAIMRRRERDEARAELAAAMSALAALHSACDRIMGDSDLPDDDSPEMEAMQQAAALLWPGRAVAAEVKP